MKRTKKVSKTEWKKLNQQQKKQVKAAKKDNWKCSGKKKCHGLRSSVAKTWDSSKGRVANVKVLAPSDIPDDRLDKMSDRIAKATGWSYNWVRSMKPNAILKLAQKYL